MLLFSTSKERVARDVAHVTLKQSLATLKGNRPLLMLCLSALSFLVGMFTLQTVQAYYARDVLGDANYFIILTVVSTGVMFVVAAVHPPDRARRRQEAGVRRRRRHRDRRGARHRPDAVRPRPAWRSRSSACTASGWPP